MEEDRLKNRIGLVLIGGSAGSLEVIIPLLQELRVTDQLPILIVLHRKAGDDSGLVELFSAKTKLEVKEAEEKDELLPDTVYVAPADYHLLIEDDGTLSLDDSEKENYSRPNIDITFQSAAEVFGSRLLCILLSGANADGTEGLVSVKKYGGTVIVQDPASAYAAFMPANALKRVAADKVLSANEIAGYINSIQRIRF